MTSQGRITRQDEAELRGWEPELALRRLSAVEARFSRGFSCADPLEWFSGMEKHWVPLFHFLESSIALKRCQLSFEMPPHIDRHTIIQVDGEPAVLGLTGIGMETVVRPLASRAGTVAEGLFIEYLERRLLTSVMKSWIGSAPPRCVFVSEQPATPIDVLGVVKVSLEIAQTPFDLYIGLGPRAVEKLDSLWRKRLIDERRRKGEDVLSDKVYHASIDLTELAVPPAMLIDYMRTGTLIDLEVPVSSLGLVRLDGRPWAEGEICQYNGSLAFVVRRTNLTPRAFPEGTTRVRIELGQVELDHEGVIEHHQPGAVMLTTTPVGANASLVISGENVASAVIYDINGNFALSVLPK